MGNVGHRKTDRGDKDSAGGACRCQPPAVILPHTTPSRGGINHLEIVIGSRMTERRSRVVSGRPSRSSAQYYSVLRAGGADRFSAASWLAAGRDPLPVCIVLWLDLLPRLRHGQAHLCLMDSSKSISRADEINYHCVPAPPGTSWGFLSSVVALGIRWRGTHQPSPIPGGYYVLLLTDS